MENLRQTYRVAPDDQVRAELCHGGRTMACELVNLSAGGAKVRVRMALPYDARCYLVLRLGNELREELEEELVEVPMHVLESVSLPGTMQVRMRSLASTGTPVFEHVSRLVFALERRHRARASGAADAAPMNFDAERRRKLRRPIIMRFSRKNLRPDQD